MISAIFAHVQGAMSCTVFALFVICHLLLWIETFQNFNCMSKKFIFRDIKTTVNLPVS